MKKNLIPLIVLLLLIPDFTTAQEAASDFAYNVYRVYPTIARDKEEIKAAESLLDLNQHYKSSWVKEYVSVEVLTKYRGKIRKAIGSGEKLTSEQKEHMNAADIGSEISIRVRYMPDNTLSHNDVQELDFTISVNPERDAKYEGGEEALQKYLKENAIDKISADVFVGYKLAAVRFFVDEEGRIVDPHLFWTSEDENVDALLLETICNMPNWVPASYENGLKIKQEFAWTVGNMESCVVNMLNIKAGNVPAY